MTSPFLSPAGRSLYEPVDAAPLPAVDRLVQAFERTHGGALFARVHAVGTGDDDRWFRLGSNWQTDQTFEDLLGSSALRNLLPDLAVPDPYPTTSVPHFYPSPGGILTLDGMWADELVRGGAYVRFSGRPVTAKRLCTEAVAALVGERFEHVDVYSSDHAWTSWFGDVAWDRTWIVVDHSTRLVSILCVTSED